MFLGGKVSKSVTVPGRNLSESNDKSWPGFGTRSRSQESRVLSGGGVFFFLMWELTLFDAAAVKSVQTWVQNTDR